MKYFTFLTIICISISCNRKDNGKDIDDLLYSVDTVMIDSKERLLDLDSYIFKSDINDEESSMFLFNKFDHSIDEVNLDDLQVVNNYSFVPEGPDGTGKYINHISLLHDGSIFIKSYNGSAVFDINGKLLKKIDWVNSIDSNGFEYGLIPQNQITLGSKDLKVFGLSYDNKNRNVFLDVLSVKENSVKRFDIDTEKSYHNFVLEFDDPQFRTFMDPSVYLRVENAFIIVSHQYSNEIFLFTPAGEFAKTVFYNPTLTPMRVKDLNEKRFSSNEQIEKEYQNFLEQVRFGPPVWDRVKKRYLRLSASRVFSDSRPRESSLLPDIKEVKVYLSIFDVDFNLISEVHIPELTTEFVKYFAKDGKLWVFQNISDELGFIVIDI